jgi:dCTP deaminase
MILTGRQIREFHEDGKIVIDPWNLQKVNPNSYNLSLHDELVIYDDGRCLDMKVDNPSRKIAIPEEGLILKPGELYLGRTREYTETHGLVPLLEGRSSIGRLGIFIHATAGFGDIGFKGYWTLEISVIRAVRIYAGVDVCQIFYHPVDGAYDTYAKGKYQGNREIQTSMIWKDFIDKKK